MNIFKRLICFLLCIVIISGVSSVCAVEVADAQGNGKTYGENAYGILNCLAITETGKKQLGESITRGEFFKMACIAAGYDKAMSEEVIFSDLSLEHEYEPYIKTLAKLGVVGGTADGKILPDGAISMSEAMAVTVKLLGYGLMAEAKGGYPSGYYGIGKNIGLLKEVNIPMNTVLTKGMALQLVKNALVADLMVQTGFGSDSEYEVSKGTNLLNSVFKVYCVEGVLDGVDISRIVGDNDIDEFFIQVGETEIEVRGIDAAGLYELLGYNVAAYYTVELRDYYKLIYIEKSDRNTEKIFDISDVEIKTGEIEAYDEATDSYKVYSFNRSIPVIYNGTATENGLSADMVSGKHGKVKLLDNGSGSWEIVFIDAFENYIAGHIDAERKLVYDKYDKKKATLKLDNTVDDPYTIIYDYEGKEISVEEIQTGDIISVYRSYDEQQQYIRAYVINNSVSGKIVRKKEKSGIYITLETVVDGKGVKQEFKLNPESNIALNTDKYPVGASVILRLDKAGNVAEAEIAAETVMKYAFVMASDCGEDDGLRGILKLKIYTQDNVEKIFKVAERVKVDGKLYRGEDSDKIIARLKAAAIAQQAGTLPQDSKAVLTEDSLSTVVRFALDEEEKLSVIDTVLSGETDLLATREETLKPDDSMFCVIENRAISGRLSPRLRVATRTYGYNIAYSSAAMCMVHPPSNGDLKKMEQFFVDRVSNVLFNDQNYNVTAYYTDNKVSTSDFLSVVYADGLMTLYASATRFAVVDEVGEMLDKNGEKSGYVRLVQYDGAKDIMFEDDATVDYQISYVKSEDDPELVSELKKGDVIRAKTGTDGKIKRVTLYYRMIEQSDGSCVLKKTYPAQNVEYYTDLTIHEATVYEKTQDGMYIKVDGNLGPGTTEADRIQLVPQASTTPAYFRYFKNNRGEREIEIIDFEKVRAEKDVGAENAHHVIVHRTNGQAITVIAVE